MALVRRQWPTAAAVVTSTLQAYADRLVAAVDEGRVKLPVVEGEIGDTWVSQGDNQGREGGVWVGCEGVSGS